MNTPSWTYDSGYPSIFQGEGLNRSGACLKSHRQALIHFFKSTWKKNSLLPQRYQVPGLTVTWTDAWQVGACDWEMCQSPFLLIQHFRAKIRSVWGCAWFLFLFLRTNSGHGFFLEVEGIWSKLVSWESSFVLWLLLIWRWMYAIPVDCIKNILKQILPPSPSTPPSLTHSHALFPSPSPKK